MVNPPSFPLSIHAHAQSLESVCFLWNHVVSAICTLQFDVRLLLHRVEHMPGGRGRDMPWFALCPRLFRGSAGSLLRPKLFSAAMDFYVRRWPHLLTMDPPEYYPLLPSSCRSKLETLIDLGLGGLASWWLHCLAPRSPLTAYCVARAHADGLTAAPSLAYPILHGATLEGGVRMGACGRFGWVNGGSRWPSHFFLQYTIGTPHKSSCEPAQTVRLIYVLSPSFLVLGPLPAQREPGRGRGRGGSARQQDGPWADCRSPFPWPRYKSVAKLLVAA